MLNEEIRCRQDSNLRFCVKGLLFLQAAWDLQWFKSKQGRIHGYPSRVQVGRGRNLGHQIIWAGAVKPKTAKTPKHVSVMDQWMDGWTDRPTKRVVMSRNTWLRPGGAAQVVVFLVFIRGLQTILKNSPGEHHQQQTDIAGCRVEYQTIDDWLIYSSLGVLNLVCFQLRTRNSVSGFVRPSVGRLVG